MNDNLNKPRPRRPRISQFKSVDDFWRYHTDHPEAFITMDVTGVLEMATKVRERVARLASERRLSACLDPGLSAPETAVDKREFQREKTASKDGIGRELNGNSRASAFDQPEQTRTNPDESERPVGYKSPPAEHRFKPGNPGGPGGQLGPRSMRKHIRTILFGDEVEDGFAMEVTKSLFLQAIKGNTHAIRIICENGNNRRKRV